MQNVLNFYRFSCFKHPSTVPVPPWRRSRHNFESFLAFRLAVKAYLPGPLMLGSTQVPFLYPKPLKPPHLEHFSTFREVEPDNVLVLFLAVHLHKQFLFKLTSRASPRLSRKPFAPVQQAQSREEFLPKVVTYSHLDSINASEPRSNYKNNATLSDLCAI